MGTIDRVTLIDEKQGREQKVPYGHFIRGESTRTIRIPASKTPQWVKKGCHVVAATCGGSVLDSYRISKVKTVQVTIRDTINKRPGPYVVISP